MFVYTTTTNLSSPRPITLVGLMGSGKSSVGFRLSRVLNFPFVDSDEAILSVSGSPDICTIYKLWGEKAFKEIEASVIQDLVNSSIIRVISTGDGAFVQDELRQLILEKTICIWLKADLNVIHSRVKSRLRPQLCEEENEEDQMQVLQQLYEERYPIYSQAHITIDSCDDGHDKTVKKIMAALQRYLVPFATPSHASSTSFSKENAAHSSAEGYFSKETSFQEELD